MARERDDEYDDDRDDDRPRRRRDRDDGDPAVGRQMVRGPGTWLVVAAGVMLVSWLINIGVTASGYDVGLMMTEWMGQFLPPNGPARADFDKKLEEMRTRDRTPEYVQAAIFGVIGLAANVVVLLGGLRLRQARSKGLAMTGSILAIVPINSCCLIGLPIGIWALVTLGKPDVKAAFAASARPRDDLDDRG